MAKPTFSIVTPSFNQAQFIERTIQSVLSQEGDLYIDYIIADGGSTDETVSIIKRYAQAIKTNAYSLKCKGITLQWWSHKDRGQANAINEGFRVAKGDYAAWINSDDLYTPGAFAHAARVLAQNPTAGMVYSNWVDIDINDKELERHEVIPFDLGFEINSGNLIPSPTVFMRREVLEAVNYIDEKYNFAFDYDLWIKIGQKYPIIYEDAWWAEFRLHDTSKTVSLSEKFWGEEREISLRYGGRRISRLYLNHLAKRWPLPMKALFKMERAGQLIAEGDFPLVWSKVKKNVRYGLNKIPK